jgi:hypothetical protein
VAFKCPTAQIYVLWPLQPYLPVHKYVYFGHIHLTFQCTNMCSSATSTLPFGAQICVLWPLKVNMANVSLALLSICTQNLIFIRCSRILSLIFPPMVWSGHVLLPLLLRNERLIGPAAHVNSSWNISKRARVHEIDRLNTTATGCGKAEQKKQSYPRNGPWRPIGLWDVKDPTLSRQSAHSS